MRLNRKLLAPLAAAAAAALALVGAPASTAAVHNPILFVHGWGGNGSVWNNMIGKFKADGWSSGSLYTISYNSYASNKTTANAIKTKVGQIRAAHGGAKVDVITHSMGGLNSRWYLKFLGGTSSVDEWVSLGGPNHGTSKARDCLSYSYNSCSEMLPGSSFLQQLNANDETPGYVRYGTWWSPATPSSSRTRAPSSPARRTPGPAASDTSTCARTTPSTTRFATSSGSPWPRLPVRLHVAREAEVDAAV